MNVWDYSGLPGNILGQTCPQFALLFLPLSAIAIIVDDFVRWKCFGEEKPRYKWRWYGYAEKIVEQIHTEDCERCEKGIGKGF